MTEILFHLPAPHSVCLCYSSRINTHRENQPSVNGSSSNAAATRLSEYLRPSRTPRVFHFISIQNRPAAFVMLSIFGASLKK